MKPALRVALMIPAVLLTSATAVLASGPAHVGPKPSSYWQVDDVRPGMKGVGRTVMRGTKIETFQAEVLGILKNTSPGRDLVLARLSGLGLEKSGVIAGMSGSPVYLDNKLLGAVAYAWAFGKEPIAGITPFSQMHGFVESFERRDLAEKDKPNRVGLLAPITIDGKTCDAVTVSQSFEDPPVHDGMWLTPLRMPLAASGFTPRSLELLRDRSGNAGFLPMQGGAAPGRVLDEEKDTPLEPGSPLAVSLISGDFDLSGIGTVTHIEGNRVYGWGHPFMSLGNCEFPLNTGYIHTVYPRQTVSFKMGSPLKTVGIINADVSTGIAGWLGRKPDLLPVRMAVALRDQPQPNVFNVRVVRQRTMLPTLVFTALTNSVDMEGELPEEMTAELQARLEIEGREPLIVKDTFSGTTGGRAPQALYGQVAAVLQILNGNPFQSLRITRIDCDTRILPGRRTAEIDAVELDSETYRPGDTVKAAVFVRPYKAGRQRLTVSMKLPSDLSEGSYTALVCDDVSSARMSLKDNPALALPRSNKDFLDAIRLMLDARRTNLVLRLPVGPSGVAVDGQTLPDLPASMIQVLAQGRRTGAQAMAGALVAREATEWVLQGAESVRFTVSRNKKARGIDD